MKKGSKIKGSAGKPKYTKPMSKNMGPKGTPTKMMKKNGRGR
jgi:hypothetical protein